MRARSRSLPRRRDDGALTQLHVRCNNEWRTLSGTTVHTTVPKIVEVIRRMCGGWLNIKVLRRIPAKRMDEPPFMKFLMDVMDFRYVELCADSHLTLGQLRDPPFNERGEKWIVLYELLDGTRAQTLRVVI